MSKNYHYFNDRANIIIVVKIVCVDNEDKKIKNNIIYEY